MNILALYGKQGQCKVTWESADDMDFLASRQTETECAQCNKSAKWQVSTRKACLKILDFPFKTLIYEIHEYLTLQQAQD